MKILHIAFWVFVFASVNVFAKPETTAIVNAHIFALGRISEIESGTIVFDQHKILYVGESQKLAKLANVVIDAKGEIVTPGLMITNSTLGVDEVPAEKSTTNSQIADSPFSAGLNMADSINPRSTLIPIARLTGATTAVIVPSLQADVKANVPWMHLFSGQAAVLDLVEELNFYPQKAMVLEAGEKGAKNLGGSISTLMAALKVQLEDARSYAANKEAYQRNQMRTLSIPKTDLEALQPVLRREMPLLVEVHRASEILKMIEFANKEDVKLILSGVSEGWIVADKIAAAKIPVLLNAGSNLPASFESLSSSLQNADILARAGVRVSIHGPDFKTGGKTVRLFAGLAVSRGLSWKEGLAAVTLNPAKTFGVSDKIGSLEVGKKANLVLWHGDPLDTSGYAEKVFIGGKEMPMRSRQTELRDRYLARDNGLPMQYRY